MKKIMALVFGLILQFYSHSGLGRISFPQDPSRGYEVKFSRAVQAYQEKKLDVALKFLEEIDSDESSQRVLELKAIVLKELKAYDKAEQVHQEIINKVTAAGLEREQAAPSLFELGVFSFLKFHYEKAMTYFDEAIGFKFNAQMAHYYKALIHLKMDHPNEALSEFDAVGRMGSPLLAANGLLQASKISSDLGRSDESLQYLFQAKRKIEKQMALMKKQGASEILNTSAFQLYTAEYENLLKLVQGAAKDFLSDQWFQSLTMLYGYDSNILMVPETGSLADLFTNRGGTTGAIKGMIGHTSSPFKEDQSLWAYQFYGNYQFNQTLKNAQFFVHDYHHMWAETPLMMTSSAWRVHGNVTFQNQTNLLTEKSTYSPYSLTGDIEWTLRQKKGKGRTQTHLVGLAYNAFLLDPIFVDYLKKSGTRFYYNFVWAQDSGDQFWNPQWILQTDWNQASGKEFQAGGLSFSVKNSFYLSQKHTAFFAARWGLEVYPARPILARRDWIQQWLLEYDYNVTPWLKVFLTGDLYQNNSNVEDIYSYSKQTGQLGVNYAF